MKISSKGRYALASMITMAKTAEKGASVTVSSLSQRLNLSKIYLEQVFSLLRRSGLVTSMKGAQGGYQLARPAAEITAYDILSATETSLFEEPENTVKDAAPGVEEAMRELLFTPADAAFAEALKSVSLAGLAEEAARRAGPEGYMYYL